MEMEKLMKLMQSLKRNTEIPYFGTITVPDDVMVNATQKERWLNNFKHRLKEDNPNLNDIFYKFEVDSNSNYLLHAVGFDDD